MARRTVLLHVSADDVLRALGAPEDTRALAVNAINDPPSIQLVIEHPEFNEVPPGWESPVRGVAWQSDGTPVWSLTQ